MCCSCQTTHCLLQADDSYVGPCPAEFFVGSMGEEEKMQIEIRFNRTHDTWHDANRREIFAEKVLGLLALFHQFSRSFVVFLCRDMFKHCARGVVSHVSPPVSGPIDPASGNIVVA